MRTVFYVYSSLYICWHLQVFSFFYYKFVITEKINSQMQNKASNKFQNGSYLSGSVSSLLVAMVSNSTVFLACCAPVVSRGLCSRDGESVGVGDDVPDVISIRSRHYRRIWKTDSVFMHALGWKADVSACVCMTHVKNTRGAIFRPPGFCEMDAEALA